MSNTGEQELSALLMIAQEERSENQRLRVRAAALTLADKVGLEKAIRLLEAAVVLDTARRLPTAELLRFAHEGLWKQREALSLFGICAGGASAACAAHARRKEKKS